MINEFTKREINWYTVLYNILVIKETKNTFTFYNLWILNWDYWCYLENYIVKEKFNLDKIIEIIEEELSSWSELWMNLFHYHLNEIESVYERPSDYQLKQLLWIVKSKLWIEENIELDIDLLEEIPEQINNFSKSDLFQNKEKIDFSKINLDDPNIDIYIKDAIQDLQSIWDIKKELKEIWKFDIEKKKSFVEKLKWSLKNVWKVWLVWTLLASAMVWMSQVNANNLDNYENYSYQWSITEQKQWYSINDFQFILSKENKWIINLNNISWIRTTIEWRSINVWEQFKYSEYNLSNTFYLRITDWNNILFKWETIFQWDWKNNSVIVKMKDWSINKLKLTRWTWYYNSATDFWWFSKWDMDELPSSQDFQVLALACLWLYWSYHVLRSFLISLWWWKWKRR